MVKQICKRNGCGYIWDYKGDAKWYASCPRCKTNVRIRTKIEENKTEMV